MESMEEPSLDDCCRSGCTNCILDIYASGKRARNWNSQVDSAMSPVSYKEFRLLKIDYDSPNCNVYTFVPILQEGEGPIGARAGEHAVLRNDEFEVEERVSRPYTIIPWDCEEVRSFSCAIKLYPNGRMSAYVRQWRIGDISHWRGFYGGVDYRPNVYDKVLMLCIGTGVAPVYALAESIARNDEDDTLVHLLYGSRTPDEIVLRRQIRRLTGYWNVTCSHFLSAGYEETQKKFDEHFTKGRIGRDEVVAQLKCSNSILVLICGTDDFNREMKTYALEAGLTESAVHVFS